MGTLVNGIGIFVLTLVAVVVGGSINAKLHPLPDLKLDKDGKITAIVPVAAPRDTARRARAKAPLYYAIDPPLVVNFEDGSAVRFLQITMEVMAHDQKAHRQRAEEHPADPQQSAAAHEQSKLPIADVARGQGEAAPGGAHRDPRRAEESRAAPTSTTCCSPVSWCSNGELPRAAPASNAISDEEVSALLEKSAADERAAL